MITDYDTANRKWTLSTGYSDGDVSWKNVNALFNVLAPATTEKYKTRDRPRFI